MLSTLLPYNNSDRQSSIVAILHPFGIIPTESFKVKQSSRFEKFIREKKNEMNYQQRQLGIFEFHWVTSEIFHYFKPSSTTLDKVNQAALHVKWFGAGFALLQQSKWIENCCSITKNYKKDNRILFFPVLFWDGWVCYYKTHSPCIRKVTHDKAIIELFQGEIWWPL